MKRLILSPRTEIFSGKPDFLKGRPNGISEWKMRVPFANFQVQVLGLLAWIAFDPTFREKKSGNGTSASLWKFLFRIWRVPQLSTNWLLRVNGKQSLSLNFQKRLEYKENTTKYRSLSWKPRSHVRILIYRTWPIEPNCHTLSVLNTTQPSPNHFPLAWLYTLVCPLPIFL